MRRILPILISLILGLAIGGVGGYYLHRPVTTSPAQPTTMQPTLADCTADHLTLSKVDNAGSGAAGHTYLELKLTNSGSATCTIDGYPGVSLTDATGTQLGDPAAKATATSSSITLKQGSSVYTTIDLPTASNFPTGACSAVSSQLKLYPPNATGYLTIPLTAAACPGWTVKPMTGSV